MIEREVEVVALNDRYVQVEAKRTSACQHCSVSNTCGTSALDKWMNRKNRIILPRTIDVQMGEKVMIGIDEVDLIRSSFVVYIIPVLLMLIAAVVVGNYTESQGLIAVAGLIALLTGFFIVRRSAGGDCPVLLLHKVTSRNLVTPTTNAGGMT